MSKSELLDSMTKKLGYPFQILDAGLTAEEIKEIYLEALKRGKEKGFTPVILPEDDILDDYFDILKDEHEYNAKDVIKQIGDGKNFLNELKEELAEDNEDMDTAEGEDFPEELIGEMADGETIDTFTSVVDSLKGNILPCALIEVPTDKPWEAVVYIPFGGWNECPMPEDMAAVCKYWYEQYGAYPAVITHDTLEFYVEKTVSKEKAVELAKEHFLFCSDRVYQGTRNYTIGEVADCLWQSDIWYFWWD